jgi:arylsulfatase A-like enzyme
VTTLEDRRLRLASLWWVALTAVISAAISFPAIAQSPPPDTTSAQERKDSARQNLLVITIDTLRADYLGAREDGKSTSPAIDAFGRTATVFENAYSHASWTLPAMATLLTSLHTSVHHCWMFRHKLSPSFVTLPEYLGEAGYKTAAFSTSPWFSESYGTGQGFDEFDLVTGRPPKGQRRPELVMKGITSQEVTARAVKWLTKHRDSEAPWLLWLHYLDPHDHYLPHEGNPERFKKDDPKTLYEGEIYYTDQWIGKLLAELDSLGLADSTVVAMTSDHGEEFEDHGKSGHGITLYDEQLHVPFIIRSPELKPRRVPNAVGTIDLMPTVLDLLDLPPLENIEGRSIAPAMRGEALEDKPVLFELRVRYTPGAKIRGLQDTRYKLILTEDGELSQLFDTKADPAEKHNQLSTSGSVAEAMNQTLKSMVRASESWQEAGGSPESANPSQEEIESLRALGYVLDPE